jgi:hypothetical protein
LPVTHGFSWIGSNPALIAFSIATVLEIGGYYIPWVDNLLDAIATPSAIVAGVLLSASTLVGIPPFFRWTFAIVGGGGAAAVFQGLTATARQLSTLSTGGLANPLLATGEAGGAVFLSVLAVTVPILAVLLLCGLLLLAFKLLFWRRPAPRPT